MNVGKIYSEKLVEVFFFLLDKAQHKDWLMYFQTEKRLVFPIPFSVTELKNVAVKIW